MFRLEVEKTECRGGHISPPCCLTPIFTANEQGGHIGQPLQYFHSERLCGHGRLHLLTDDFEASKYRQDVARVNHHSDMAIVEAVGPDV